MPFICRYYYPPSLRKCWLFTFLDSFIHGLGVPDGRITTQNGKPLIAATSSHPQAALLIAQAVLHPCLTNYETVSIFNLVLEKRFLVFVCTISYLNYLSW